MPNDAAVVELDTDKMSTDLAAELGDGLDLGQDDATLDTAIDNAADDSAPVVDDAGAQGRGPDGKFTTKAPAAPADPAAAPGAPAPAAAAAAGDLPAPKSWSKEMHPIWDKLAKGVQLTPEESRKAATYYNERESQMLTGIEGYKTDATFGKAVRTVAAPYEGLLRQQGIAVHDAVGHLFRAHAELSQGTPEQKREYLGKIARQYGVELAPAAPADPNAAALPPEVKAALERLDKIEGTLTQEQQQRFETQRTTIANDVASFAEAKDEKGNQKHPYFDECADHICLLLKGDPSMKLDAAYDTAVWANPVTRQKELARLQAEKDTEDRKKTEAAVKAAKKGTSTNVRGRDTTRAPQAPAATLDKLDDVMRETHDEIRQRTE